MPSSMLKPQIDVSKIEAATGTRSSPVIDVSKIAKKVDYVTVAAATKKGGLDDELRNTFLQAFTANQFAKAEKIATGQLDPSGNPLGTEYYDDGTPKRKRKIVGSYKNAKRKIVPGSIFGDLTVLKRGPKIKAARPNLVERWRCRCSCGRTIIVPRYYLLRTPNPKTHCGCKVATLKSQNPREYRIYMMVHQRCFNQNHVSYEHYKTRGITLYEEWRNDLHPKDGFKKFFEHVGKAPTQWHSLDRIHNSKGYEPGNLRWATSEQQRANQGDKIGGYTSDEIADLGLTEEEFIQKILDGEIE